MSKVLFVVPVFKEDLISECGGTLLLATILRENNIDVDIYRYYESGSKEDFNSFLDTSVTNILSADPAIVSFFCRGDVYLANILVAKKIKELRPEIYIVFGGPQADISAKETIEQIPWVDYCCSGEGETTIYPLFSGLLNGEDVSSVKGLTYRTADGKVISNPRPELIEDLDTLPFLDYSLLPQKLVEKTKADPIPISIDVGRGCPYNCTYCSTSLFWQRKFRIKSPERIIDEMKLINKQFGITQFGFDHDLFTANKARTLEFCRAFKESGLDVQWSCSSRADTIDKETIDAMAEAGMERIYLGVETGSPRMQRIIRKNLNIDKTIEIVKYLIDKGLRATVSLIYGFPEETYDDLNQTLQLVYTIYKYGSVKYQFHLCAIFPGTEYFSKYKDEMVLSENPNSQTGHLGVKENIEFIQKHKNLFPFYYEYQSELRSRLGVIDRRVMLLFMELYDHLITLDPEKFADKRIIDMYLNYIDANKALLDKDTETSPLSTKKPNLVANYVHTEYNKDDAQKVLEVLKFKDDLVKLKSEKKDITDIRIYNADIQAVIKEKTLKDISSRTSMVCITIKDRKVTCGVQYMN